MFYKQPLAFLIFTINHKKSIEFTKKLKENWGCFVSGHTNGALLCLLIVFFMCYERVIEKESRLPAKLSEALAWRPYSQKRLRAQLLGEIAPRP